MKQPTHGRKTPTKSHPWKIVCVPDHGESFIWTVYSTQNKAIKYATYLSTKDRRCTFRVEKELFF